MGILVDSDTKIRVSLRPLSSHQYFRFTLIMYHGFCRVQIRTAQLRESNEILSVGQINCIHKKYCFLATEFIRRSNRLTAITILIVCENIMLNPCIICN